MAVCTTTTSTELADSMTRIHNWFKNISKHLPSRCSSQTGTAIQPQHRWVGEMLFFKAHGFRACRPNTKISLGQGSVCFLLSENKAYPPLTHPLSSYRSIYIRHKHNSTTLWRFFLQPTCSKTKDTGEGFCWLLFGGKEFLIITSTVSLG